MSDKNPPSLPDQQPLELDQLKKQASAASKSTTTETNQTKKENTSLNSAETESAQPGSKKRVLKLLLLNALSLVVIITIYWAFFLPSMAQQEKKEANATADNSEDHVPSEQAVVFPIIDMSGDNASQTGKKLFSDEEKSEEPSKPATEPISSLLAGLDSGITKRAKNPSTVKPSSAPSEKKSPKNKPPKAVSGIVANIDPILITDYSLLELSRQSDSFVISDDEKYLLEGGLEGNTSLWDLETKNKVASFPQIESNITCLAFLSNSTKILIGYADHSVRLFEIVSPDNPIELKGHQSPIIHTKILDDKHAVTVDQSGTVHTWDLSTLKSIKSFSINSHATQLFSLPGSTSLHVSHWGSQVSLWDWKAGTFQKELPMMGGPNSTQQIGANRESIISLDNTGLVQFWDANNHALSRSFSINFPARSIVTLSRNGNILAAGASDGNIGLYNLETGLQTHQLQLPEKIEGRRPVSILISAMGDTVISINAIGKARVWKTTQSQ